MLATSNVPVWAAEFSDGSEPSVTTETPVAETFSDDAAEAPVVEDNTADVNAANEAEVSGNQYSVTYTPISFTATGATSTPVEKNTMTWADGTLSTTVSVTDNKILTDAKYNRLLGKLMEGCKRFSYLLQQQHSPMMCNINNCIYFSCW